MDIFKRKMKATIVAYQRLFDSEDGKTVLQDLCKSCHVFNSTFDKDPYETHFNEGARSVVLRIMKTVGMTETELENLMKESEEHYE